MGPDKGMSGDIPLVPTADVLLPYMHMHMHLHGLRAYETGRLRGGHGDGEA